MMSIKQVSSLTGVSARTLQYYDKIGLLHPAKLTEAGYRLYDDASLEKLQQILLFRELAFSLKEIRTILDDPNFDRDLALTQQITLLKLKREHLDDLIAFAERVKQLGVDKMSFHAFRTDKVDAYAKQAKEKWGSTQAYSEYAEKSKDRSKERENIIGQGLMDIFSRFGKMKGTDPNAPEAQALVKTLQDYITEHYYTCTPQILASLGQMYCAGGEFTENIDAAGGTGTADFAAKAIAVFCK